MSPTKKIITITLAASMLAVSSVARTLKYSDHEAPDGMRTRFLSEVLFPAIEKESNGRLKIEAYWNGEIASSYDALRVVSEGRVVDMAIVVPEYAPKDLPLHQIFKSFPTGPSEGKQIAFFRRVYAEIPAFPVELKNKNLVNVFFATGFPVAFFSRKPLRNLDDIKGGTWRSASFWHRDFLKNTGAKPVTMPWGDETYKALKVGTLDGVMVNLDGGYQIKAQEVAPYGLASAELWLGHIYLLAMNKDTWDGLAKEDKDAIQRAAEIAYKSLGSVMRDGVANIAKMMRNDGMKIRMLESGELAQWKTVTKYQEAQAAWVKEQEAKGMKDVGAVLVKVSAIMKEVMDSRADTDSGKANANGTLDAGAK